MGVSWLLGEAVTAQSATGAVAFVELCASKDKLRLQNGWWITIYTDCKALIFLPQISLFCWTSGGTISYSTYFTHALVNFFLRWRFYLPLYLFTLFSSDGPDNVQFEQQWRKDIFPEKHWQHEMVIFNNSEVPNFPLWGKKKANRNLYIFTCGKLMTNSESVKRWSDK